MLLYRRKVTSTVHRPIPLNGSIRREQPFRIPQAHILRALSLLHMLITTTAQAVLPDNLHRPRLTLVGINLFEPHHNRRLE